MKLIQREHPEAANEFEVAVRWYEEQEPGVGLRFLDRTFKAREEIGLWPSAAPPFMIVEDGTVIRSKSVRGYPYHVIYSVESNSIFILAYAHSHRKPGYWLGRINN